MRIIMYCKNVKLSDDGKHSLEEKLRKLEKFASDVTEVYVEIEKTSHQNLKQMYQVDISLFVPKEMLHSSAEGETSMTAIDLALPKLHGQIEKYKAKRKHKEKKKNFLSLAAIFRKKLDESPRIVKRKRFSCVKPMSEAEAIRQMNLIDHDFYLFWNANTDRFSVVYRRSDNNYGIIEPLLEDIEEKV